MNDVITKPFDSQVLVHRLRPYGRARPMSAMLPSDGPVTMAMDGNRLHEHAQVAFADKRADARETPGSLGLEKQALVDHLFLFRQQSRSVSEHFGSISTQLRRLLDEDTLARLRERIDSLPFSAAQMALEASALN